jgi:hypothetical protein
MFDTESLLLVSILQKAYPLDPQPPAKMFLHHFAFEIDRTFRVLEFLGLVENAASKLGFKPTHRLIDIVVNRMTRPNTEGNNPIAKVNPDCFGWLWHHVVGDLGDEDEVELDAEIEIDEEEVLEKPDEETELDEGESEKADDEEEEEEEDDDDGDVEQGLNAEGFCRQVFLLLGLLKWNGGIQLPTRLMHDLLLEGCFQHLSEKH